MSNVIPLKTTRHRTSKCPTCSQKLNASTNIEGEDISPTAGDITICTYCSTILQYDEELLLHRMEIDELMALPTELQHQLRLGLKAIGAGMLERHLKDE